MKKLHFLFIIVLFLTGCSAVVNVSIDKNNVTETINISENNLTKYNRIKNSDSFPIPLYYDQELDVPLWMPNRKKESGVSYYDVKNNDTNKTVKVIGNFSIKDHARSSLVRNCFRYYNIIKEEQKTIFSTSKGLTCSYNNFVLNVSTPYVVTSNNATRVNKDTNTYTWNIDSSNSKNVGIYLEIDFSRKYNEKQTNNNANQNENNESSYTYLTAIIIIVLLVLCGMFLYSKKHNNSDK